jgi:feruloyl esterase
MRFRPLSWLAGSTLLCGAAVMSTGARAGTCEGLTALGLPNTDISLAQTVPAGSFAAPDGTTYTDLPAFCRVTGVAHPTSGSNIGFEVWLPTTSWNRKFQGVGNSGLAGSVVYAALALAVQQGYAAAGTDDGHTGSSPLWMENQTQLVDFGTRAVHTTASVAKEVIGAFYGRAPTFSYFVGCSEGGRESMMEAQRFPEDYDGIIAGDPFSNASRTVIGQLYLSAVLLRGADYALDLPPLQTLHSAVLTQCDAKDGVADGVLTDPKQCRFDPRQLLCRGGATAGCLTAGQVDSAVRFYQGTRDPVTDKQLFPGQVRGGEVLGGVVGWYLYQLSVPLDSFSLQILPYAVFHNPNWDYTTFNYHSDSELVDQTLGPVWNATNPDLEAFQRRGGKLIGFHGYADWLITPFISTDYYDQVTERSGWPQSFYRLFTAPGVGHCNGGPGPNAFGISGQPAVPNDADHSVIAALDRWVTRGEAPASIIATKFVNDDPTQGVATTRPLCPYPQTAAYNGHGNTNDARNFHCAFDETTWRYGDDDRSVHTEE